MVFYVLLISTSIAITTYLFLNLDKYKSKIEQAIFTQTGYNLVISEIKTSLSNSLLPEITINNPKLIGPNIQTQILSIAQLKIVLSYSSIWNLEPIFDQINIDGVNIDTVKMGI